MGCIFFVTSIIKYIQNCVYAVCMCTHCVVFILSALLSILILFINEIRIGLFLLVTNGRIKSNEISVHAATGNRVTLNTTENHCLLIIIIIIIIACVQHFDTGRRTKMSRICKNVSRNVKQSVIVRAMVHLT